MRPTAIQIFEDFKSKNLVSSSDRMLVIGGTDDDAQTLLNLGFKDITILNLDEDAVSSHGDRVRFKYGNAMESGIPDGSFDIAFTSDCLHHCSSPQFALTEMYRIARKLVIVLESRDSLLLRVASWMGVSQTYEIFTKNLEGYGGVNDSEIPNYIYRWTEREFEKTIQSFDPTIKHRFFYTYDLNFIPEHRVKELKSPLKRWSIRLLRPIVKLFHVLFQKQCNTFAMTVLKDPDQCELVPWLEHREGRVRPKVAFYDARFRS